MIDPLGRVTDHDYDTYGRRVSTTYALGTVDEATVRWEYADLSGNVTAVIDELARRTEYEYDSNNRLVKVTEADPDGAGELTSPVTTYEFDKRGNVLSMTDANGNTTQYGMMSAIALSSLLMLLIIKQHLPMTLRGIWLKRLISMAMLSGVAMTRIIV